MFRGDGSKVGQASEEPQAQPPPSPSTALRLFSSPAPSSSSTSAASWAAPVGRGGGGFVGRRAAEGFNAGGSSGFGAARYRARKVQRMVAAPGEGSSSWGDAEEGFGAGREIVEAGDYSLRPGTLPSSASFLNGKSKSTFASTTSQFFPCENESLTNAVSNLKRWTDVFGGSSNSDTFPPQVKNVPPKIIDGSDPSSVSQPQTEVVPNAPHHTLDASSSQGSYINCLAHRHENVYDTTNQEMGILQASQGLSLGDLVVMPSTSCKRKAVPEECINSLSSEGFRSRENTALENQLPRQTLVRSSFAEFNDELEGLMVLVRKELTKSDVGSTGRIVLPKKEAEEKLPPFDESGGIMLDMEDLIFPMTWSFKYRFWSNNRSRMYVIENTGDFVKGHGLQPGDLFIIYKSNITGAYIAGGKRRIQQPMCLDVTSEECNVQRYMGNNSLNQVVQTVKGRRKRRTRIEQSKSSAKICGSSTTMIETDYFPKVSLNNSEKEPLGPSHSPISVPDFDLDSFFDGFMP